MTAPVNPEGQTAREQTTAVQKEDRGIVVGLRRYPPSVELEVAGGGCALYACTESQTDVASDHFGKTVVATCDARGFWRFAAPVPEKPATPIAAQRQTAQEVRQRAEALWIALNRPAMTSNKGIDLIVRALASTPSPAKQTEQKIASAEGAALKSGAAPAPLEWCEKHECPREVCGNYQHQAPAETAGQKEGR